MLKSSIYNQSSILIHKIQIYSIPATTNNYKHNNKILASNNPTDVEWLESSSEREYLYLISGIVIICCWCICCVIGFLCYHDKNKTRRAEIQLELEKLKSVKLSLEMQTVGSNNMYNNANPDEYTLDDPYVRATSIGDRGISSHASHPQLARETSNVTNNSRATVITRKQSDASHISHRTSRRSSNITAVSIGNNNNNKPIEQDTMIIADIPRKGDKIKVKSKPMIVRRHKSGHKHKKAKTEVNIGQVAPGHAGGRNNGGNGERNARIVRRDIDLGRVSGAGPVPIAGPGARGNNVGMMRGNVMGMNIQGRKDMMMEEITYRLNVNNMSKNVKRNAKKMRIQHGGKQVMMRRGVGNDGDDEMDNELTEILSSDGDNESMYISPKRDGYWTKGTGTIRD